MGDAVARKMMSALRVDLPGSTGPVGGGGGGGGGGGPGPNPPPPPPPAPLPSPPPASYGSELRGCPFLSGGVRTILLRIRCWFGVNATWC